MATTLEFEQSFPADPATVMTMFRDPAYVERKGERSGSREITVSVEEQPDGGTVVVSKRRMPANVPSFAQAIVGDTITVTETQHWGPPAEDGACAATVTVEFSAPISYHGSIALMATDGGSVARTDGQFKAAVPFVGGKLEKIACDQTEDYLRTEEQVGGEWLNG